MVDDKELTCRDFGRLLCREAGWNFLPSNIPAPPAKEQESTEHLAWSDPSTATSSIWPFSHHNFFSPYLIACSIRGSLSTIKSGV